MDELNFCIISGIPGIPGIGKTTLAEIILIKYLEMDFEIIKVSQNINEAFGVYSLGKKQIFLYDDFLGQTGLDIRLSKNEDNDILDFIKHIRKDSNAKFVLTTREYILNQAKAKHESFARSDFDIRRCTISLSDYSKYDKAKILYNYIYFNKLDREYIDNILANDFMKIIYHNNYNPRIIETFTTVLLPKDPQFFFDEIINNLNNPQKIWQNDFERQISNEARDLLILLVSLPPKADIVLVNKIFNYYHSEKSKFYTKSFSDNDYRNALKELDGNFIVSKEMRVSFHNPSVKDFLENYILENDVEFKILCSTAMCFEQCVSLFNLSAQKEHKLIRKYNNKYIKTLFRNFLEIEFNGLTIYIYRLFASVDCSSISDRVIFLLKANKVLNSKAIYEFLRDDVFVKIAQYLKLFSEDLEELGKLINYIIRSNEVELLDERNVTKIRDYAIEAVRDYKVERFEK